MGQPKINKKCQQRVMQEPVQTILLIRHGIAEDRRLALQHAKADSYRSLTPSGIKKLQKAKNGLKKLVPDISLFVTSPLLRAQQTAEIFASCYQASPVKESDKLSPGGSPEDFFQWLKSQGELKTVALVGHEPDLGYFASWLLCDDTIKMFSFKKGAICCIERNLEQPIGHSRVQWFLTNKQLRKLA